MAVCVQDLSLAVCPVLHCPHCEGWECGAGKTGISKGGLLPAEEQAGSEPTAQLLQLHTKRKFLGSHRNERGNQRTQSRRGSMIRACGCLQSMWHVCVKDKESVAMRSSLQNPW